MFEVEVGMIPLSKPIVIDFFNSLAIEEIIDIATKVGKNAIFDIALFMKAKKDIDSFIEWFEMRMKNSSMIIFHLMQGNMNIYTVKHDVCLNWSVYNKIVLKLIFNEIFKKDVYIEVSEGSFTFTFEK